MDNVIAHWMFSCTNLGKIYILSASTVSTAFHVFNLKKMRDGILSKVSELENEEQYCKFTCRAEKDLNIFENA